MIFGPIIGKIAIMLEAVRHSSGPNLALAGALIRDLPGNDGLSPIIHAPFINPERLQDVVGNIKFTNVDVTFDSDINSGTSKVNVTEFFAAPVQGYRPNDSEALNHDLADFINPNYPTRLTPYSNGRYSSLVNLGNLVHFTNSTTPELSILRHFPNKMMAGLYLYWEVRRSLRELPYDQAYNEAFARIILDAKDNTVYPPLDPETAELKDETGKIATFQPSEYRYFVSRDGMIKRETIFPDTTELTGKKEDKKLSVPGPLPFPVPHTAAHFDPLTHRFFS